MGSVTLIFGEINGIPQGQSLRDPNEILASYNILSILVRNFMRIILATILLCITFSSAAARVETTGTILKLYSYSEQAGYDGDVVIIISNPPVGCESGLWLRKASTEGYANTISFLLSAFHANTTVQFGALSDEIWTGSGGKFCRIDQVALIK